MTDEPRDPKSHTEVHRVADPESTRVADLSRPARRGRARPAPVLRRAGHERDAQVDPGRVRGRGRGADRQPGAAGRGLRRRPAARRCSSARSTRHVVDAREEFAREYVLPAIKANADYGDGYPLFTALGRPLIAKLAVEYARRTGCDTIAHGCTGKGNDQVRIEGDGRDARAGAEGDRPGALVGDGPRRGDRLRAQARDPGQGRHRDARRTRSTTTCGAARRRASGSRTSRTRPTTTSSSSSRGPELAPDEAEIVEVEFEAGVPVALERRAAGLVDADRARPPSSACGTGSGSSTTSRTGSSA